MQAFLDKVANITRRMGGRESINPSVEQIPELNFSIESTIFNGLRYLH
jgi:hypothetical protein